MNQLESGNLSEITKDTYNKFFQTYVDSTISVASGEFKDWMDLYLSYLPKGGMIFEIGSATGRDARYFASKGFTVVCTDIIPEALHRLSEEGFKTEIYDFQHPPNPSWINAFDGYFANAVLLHAKPDMFVQALRNIHFILKDKGVTALSLKNGSGELITSEKMGAPRYFCFHNEQEIREMLPRLGFEIIDLRHLENGKWVDVIFKKQSNTSL